MSSPASSCLGGAMTAHSIWPRKRSKRPSGHHSSERSDPATANASLDDKSRKSYQGRIAPLGPGASRVEWMMNLCRWRPQVMKRKPGRKEKRRTGKTVLRLPDLEVAKSAVLNNLSCPDAQRGYRHAIDEFVEWYCSEPRLSFSTTVVVRYRMHLETRHLAPGTINLRLGAVRRLAYEASDCGLLSPDPAAGIRRVMGVKKIGVRLGNWLTPEQSERLWNTPDCQLLKGKRDRALLAVLLACGLRRHEAVRLDFGHVQQREDHAQIPLGRLNGDMPEKKLNLLQTIVDWKGKAGHIRTVPMPGWVKVFLDEWQ